CFSWFNMRPMEKTENRKKSATIDWELFNEQLDRSVSFMTMMNEESWFNYRDQNLLSDFNRIITQYFNNYPKFNLFLINKDYLDKINYLNKIKPINLLEQSLKAFYESHELTSRYLSFRKITGQDLKSRFTSLKNEINK
ncbi:hypothetical protein, partial [Bartonella sp. CL50QHWL]|uniref:hypothetical protein n=1 Tax=Bartonella sp. CL50QHWL TaxID=3243536 RepID=UPI0035CFCA37